MNFLNGWIKIIIFESKSGKSYKVVWDLSRWKGGNIL